MGTKNQQIFSIFQVICITTLQSAKLSSPLSGDGGLVLQHPEINKELLGFDLCRSHLMG